MIGNDCSNDKEEIKINNNTDTLIDQFKLNWLKYNLLRKRERGSSVKFKLNDLEYCIIKKVNKILSHGNLQNKIHLYCLIRKNDMDTLYKELSKLENNLKEKNHDIVSICNIT